MHILEAKVRAAGDAYISAEKAYEAVKVEAATVGYKVTIQSNPDGKFVNVTGGPEPEPAPAEDE